MSYTEGVSVAAMTADLDIAMMGILLGDVNDTYTGYLDNAFSVVHGTMMSSGPLQNAFAFLDYNKDGILNNNETSMHTRADGSFTLTPTSSSYNLVGQTDATTTNTLTGTTAEGILLVAPFGASVITPFTTLMVNGDLTTAQVLQVFGLPAGLDLLSYDPFSSDANSAEALAVQIVENQIMAIVTTFAAAAEGSGASQVESFNLALNSVAKFMQVKLADSTTIDLSSIKDLGAIKAQVIVEFAALAVSNVGLNLTAFNAVLDDTATAVANVNAKIGTVTDLISSETQNIFSTTEALTTQVKTAAEAEVTSPGSAFAGPLTFPILDVDECTIVAEIA